MGIRINQNIISLLIQNNLAKAGRMLQSSFERLSSGEKINKSADDPAGLSSSQQIRYQVSGLLRNQQNIGSAFSLLGTAETSI